MEMKKPAIKSIPYDEFKDNETLEALIAEINKERTNVVLGKLDDLRRMGYTGLLEADGGVSMLNIKPLRDHGLDVAVMGTAMLGSADPAKDMAAIHAL
jgi:pentose-5-phosphate-3-epimerase